VADADARYTRALAPLLLARGGHPVALLTPFAVFLDTGPSPAQWHTVALMRHRSRRDFLDMITSSEYARAEVHKWASVADTLVIGSEGIVVPDPRALLFAFAASLPQRLRGRLGTPALTRAGAEAGRFTAHLSWR
jgi:hypothetical protein